MNIDDIITRMFEYIEMLRKHDVQEWIFEEIKELNSLNFRFRGIMSVQNVFTILRFIVCGMMKMTFGQIFAFCFVAFLSSCRGKAAKMLYNDLVLK